MTHYLQNGIREYSQWFCGANNNVAYALSQENSRTDNKVTQIICSQCSSQLLHHFKIVPLPNKTVSWLILLLWRLPVKQQLVETHSTTKLGHVILTLSTILRKHQTWWQFFLKGISRKDKIKILGGFTVAVRQGWFSLPHDAPLAESTVSDSLNHVAVVFMENRHEDLKQDAERNVAPLLRKQLRSYKKDYTKGVQQKALHVCILHLLFL